MRKGTPDSEMKLIAIKTKTKVYISDNIENKSYHSSYLTNYLFNGETPLKTFKSDWFEISSIPTKIERKVPRQAVKSWYELQEKYYNTGLPKTLTEGDFEEGSEYESVYGLYESKHEYAEGGLEEIPFKLSIIEELDEFELTRSDFELQHSLLDRITTHPVLLSTKPCTLSKAESYKIVRKYIKNHIDHRYASVTSDYDFCLTVSKKIEHDPVAYRVDVGKRKPKYETRFQRSRTVKVYETAPSPYQGYPVIQEFSGKNEEDLKNNIQIFLDELMEKINEPFVECDHCKGMGVVLNEV